MSATDDIQLYLDWKGSEYINVEPHIQVLAMLLRVDLQSNYRVLSPVGASTPYTIATANVFQTVFAANSNRKAVKVQNLGSVKLELASGATGSEVLLHVLNPSEDFSMIIGDGITHDKISVRSAAIGGKFIAWEA